MLGVFDPDYKSTFDPLPIEKCEYRGEGNSSIVVALSGERKVIRLKKFLAGEVINEKEGDFGSRVNAIEAEVAFINLYAGPFLDRFACLPVLKNYSQADIAKLLEKIKVCRYGRREDIKFVRSCAFQFPDYTFLPQGIMGNSNKSTFCVEIKPKQGIYTKSDKQFTKCSHCLMQYYKTRHGKYPKRDYCPRELFSLYPEKIKFALRNLLMSPQNNLRIFENGQLVYDHDEGDLGAVLKRWFGIKDGVDNETKFLDLVCQTLTRDIYFERSDDLDDWESKYAAVELRAMKVKAPSRLNPELVQEAQTLLQSVNQCLEIRPDYEHDDFRNVCRLGWKGLHYSVRARILEMQLSHQCGTDVVAWIRNNLSVILDDEMTISQLDRFSLAARCENAVDSDDVESRKRKILSDWIKQGKISEQNRKEEDACNQLIDENILKNFTIEDCCQILQNYLIFCTARDCSIMMAFQEEVKDKHFDNNREIDLESGQRFIFNIQVADLDPKKLGCIKKHCRRDNDVLKATIEQLKRR